MISDATIQRVLRFRDERGWRKFHTPKDLAISLNLEAAELLEVFQWSGADLECTAKKDRIGEELADVLTCCILMADACGLEPDQILNEKLCRSEEHYPVEKAYGVSTKYTDLS